MGVFYEFFGFNGRINRLGYLWRSIVILTVLTIVAVAGTAALAVAFRPQSVLGAVDLGREVLTGVFLLVLWSSFALSTRRLRDIGLEPAHIVPLYAALWVINTVLLQPMSLSDPRDFAGLEYGWVALQWLGALPLLFWPSREMPPAPTRRYDEPAQPTTYLNWRETG